VRMPTIGSSKYDLIDSTGCPDATPIRYIQSVSEIGLLGLPIDKGSVKL